MGGVLLCGRAGSGKTTRVLEELQQLVAREEADGSLARFQVLVPTYSRAEHLKRVLLRAHGGLPGLLDRGIGTFEQLAERETGVRLGELAPAPVRDALLGAALAETDVAAFRDVARFPGFRRSVLRFFKEVKASEPEPGPAAVLQASDRLRAAAGKLPGARGRKLEALAAVLPAYQQRLHAAGLLDHEDLLRRLLGRLREHPPEGLRLFAADGFTDLTEVQERIVQCLVAAADRSIVALPADPAAAAGGVVEGPFAAADDLRRRLEQGSGLVRENLAGNHRAAGDVARLERLLAGVSVDPAPADGTVRFLAGADPDDEADRVARTCLRFRSEGIGAGDILVVVRSLSGGTGARILDALGRHGVRARRLSGAPLATAPAVSGAVRALRLLAGAGERGDALHALRAGDARGVAQNEADRLGLRARTTGRDDPGSLRQAAVDDGLETCVTWLDALADAAPGGEPGPPARIAAALLGGLGAILRFSFEGDPGPEDAQRVSADAASIRRLRTLVAETAAALRAAGRGEITPADLVAALDEHLPGARYTVLDRRADVVNVVDAEEARQWEARAVVVAGLRLGEFPSLAREDLFVADDDRGAVTKEAGVRLPPRLDTALHRERMLFYAAVTRATERLVLTAPAADGKGEELHVSPFLEDALRLLPEDARDLEGAQRAPGDLRPAEGETFHRTDLVHAGLAALTERFGAEGPARVRAESGLALLRRLESERDLLSRAGRAYHGVVAELAQGRGARAAMARVRHRSASSLGLFAQCPYAHFGQYGLRIREQPAASDGLTPLLAGNLAHRALELALADGATTEDEALAAFGAAWSEVAAALPESLGTRQAREKVRRAVVGCVLAWAEEPLVPGFRPAEVEWGFSDEGALRAGGDGGGDGDGVGVVVHGKADRVDVDAQGRAIVVDYKWKWHHQYGGLGDKIASGAELQLPIYALAVERLMGRAVLAAGYLTLKDGRTRWLRLHEDAPSSGKRTDVDALGDPAGALRDAEEHVVRLDREVRAGDVRVAPRDEHHCTFCTYRDLCRHEGVGS